MRTAIIGGGAAGFFAAVNIKEMVPQMGVTIFERNRRILRKVEISGGGRCNCTNTFEGVSDLSSVYPRGHRLLKRLFNIFGPHDAYSWFERHGVPLTVQSDHCVFPASQDSHSITECLSASARRLGVRVETSHGIESMADLEGFDFVVLASGGSPHRKGLEWLHDMGHNITDPVPSLFSFSVADDNLRELMGTVCSQSTVMIEGTKFRSSGSLLITHWGLSGPAILRLSSYAARHLHDTSYNGVLIVNWLGINEESVREMISSTHSLNLRKQVHSTPPEGMPRRLWQYLLNKSIGEKSEQRWQEMGKKDLNRIVSTLCCDRVPISGRAPFHDEYVTCGGVSLTSVDSRTLESKVRKGLYFAGEVLDIDGVTGGFNFQAAWTTAYVVSSSIASCVKAASL